ncbi:MAG: hypothetical protein ABSA02_17595 [Trebonia sp.]
MAQEIQEVQVAGVQYSGGRHATHERYRGRHRKPKAPGRRRGVVRLGVTAAVAALLVCLPQPSWAGRSGTVTTRSAGASQATVRDLPNPFRLKQHQ